jgi:hypothetical protein
VAATPGETCARMGRADGSAGLYRMEGALEVDERLAAGMLHVANIADHDLVIAARND